MKPRHWPWLVLAMAVGVGMAFFALNFKVVTTKAALFCGTTMLIDRSVIPLQLHGVLHYATSRDIPQQSPAEIRVSFDVLFSIYPCNFLVFGLGRDSLMWASFNPNGFTMFLEEDPNWVKDVLSETPNITVHSVAYKTHLYEAQDLLGHYNTEPSCLPPKLHLKGNTKCRLVLGDLPKEVYEKEWDVIMIDGPKGYLPALPGRMTPIYTAAVMARLRKRPGVTHVLVHDVNRRIEKVYALTFLCRQYLKKRVDRLWHFAIPPASKEQILNPDSFFC